MLEPNQSLQFHISNSVAQVICNHFFLYFMYYTTHLENESIAELGVGQCITGHKKIQKYKQYFVSHTQFFTFKAQKSVKYYYDSGCLSLKESQP